MKNIVLLFLAVLCISNVNGQFSPEINLNSGLNDGYLWPRIVLSDDNATVIWGKTNNTIYTNTVSNGIPGNPTIQNPILKNAFISDWASTEIASEGDNIVIVYKSDNAQTGSSYLMQSNDAGQTFTAPKEIIDGISTVHRFPAISLDDGVINVAYMHFEQNWRDPQYVLIQSFDNGISFTDPKSMTSSLDGEACDCCVANIFGSEEELILLFRNVHDGYRDIYAAYFPKDDISEINYNDLDVANWALQSCPSTGSSGMVSDNIITSTFMSGQSGRDLIYIAQVDMDTDSLINSRALIKTQQSSGAQNYPQLAGKGDTLGVVWQSKESAFRNVYFSYSTTGFDGLGDEILVLSETTNGNQINPDIAFKDGVFHMVWQDNSQALVKYKTYDLNLSTSVKKIADSQIELSPVPASDVIQIKATTPWEQCQIIDLNGSQIDQINNCNYYNVNHLARGTYLMIFTNASGEKLVKRMAKI